jgi:hypothetical protein
MHAARSVAKVRVEVNRARGIALGDIVVSAVTSGSVEPTL